MGLDLFCFKQFDKSAIFRQNISKHWLDNGLFLSQNPEIVWNFHGELFKSMSNTGSNLSVEQARQIAEITSSIYEQGGKWVFREWELDTGVEKLTRGLSERSARTMLRHWRRERIETLLRDEKDSTAYAVKVWHENPSWKGEGIWQWAQRCWYATREEAQLAVERKQEDTEAKLQIFELKVSEVPGNFTVAL